MRARGFLHPAGGAGKQRPAQSRPSQRTLRAALKPKPAACAASILRIRVHQDHGLQIKHPTQGADLNHRRLQPVPFAARPAQHPHGAFPPAPASVQQEHQSQRQQPPPSGRRNLVPQEKKQKKVDYRCQHQHHSVRPAPTNAPLSGRWQVHRRAPGTAGRRARRWA